MSKRVKQLLAISIAINLLLIGAVSGHFIKKQMHPQRQGPIPEAIAQLSTDKQNLFHETMREMKQHQDEFDEVLHKQIDTVTRSLEQEPFDEQAFQEAIDGLHDLRGQQMQHLANSTKTLALQFTREERSVLAELLRRPPPRHDAPPRKPKGHLPPPR